MSESMPEQGSQPLSFLSSLQYTLPFIIIFLFIQMAPLLSQIVKKILELVFPPKLDISLSPSDTWTLLSNSFLISIWSCDLMSIPFMTLGTDKFFGWNFLGWSLLLFQTKKPTPFLSLLDIFPITWGKICWYDWSELKVLLESQLLWP